MLKAAVIGNTGGDPVLRYSANGQPLLSFDVTSRGRTRTTAGEWGDETTWVRVTVFGQRAESLAQHLRKGARVYADGRLEGRPWTDQQGQVRAGLEVMADTVELTIRQGALDFDVTDLPTTSAADERPRRRLTQQEAVYGPSPRRTATAVAERDGDDL